MRRFHRLFTLLIVCFLIASFYIGCGGGGGGGGALPPNPTNSISPEPDNNSFTGYLYAPTSNTNLEQSGLVILAGSTAPSGYTTVSGGIIYPEKKPDSKISTDSSGSFSIAFDSTASRSDDEGIVIIALPPASGNFANLAPLRCLTYPIKKDTTVQKILLHPNARNIKVGEVMQLYAKAVTDSGATVYLDPSMVTWQIDNSSIATISSSGLVRGVSSGTVNVTIKYNNLSCSGRVNVRRNEPTYRLSGSIRDSEGNPASNAVVYIDGFNYVAVADSSGNFSFPDLPGGTDLYINVYVLGSLKYTEVLNLTSDKEITIIFPGQPVENGSIKGTVQSATGDPLENVLVTSGNFNSTTNSLGNYEINDIPAGEYLFNFDKTGYNPISSNKEISSGQTATLNVTMQPIAVPDTGTLRGRVTDEAANGISSAEVTYYSLFDSSSGTTSTDTNGYYQFANIPTGSYRVEFAKAEYGSENIETEITKGVEKEVNVTLIHGPTGYYFIKRISGFGVSDGKVLSPVGIAIDSQDHLYVAEEYNCRISKFDSDGNFILKWGTRGSEDGQLFEPKYIAIDSNDNILVADSLNNRVQKYDSSGNFIDNFGSSGIGDGQFNFIVGLSVDSDDNIYVTDCNGNRVQKFSSSFHFITKWGQYGAEPGEMDHPVQVYADSLSGVYVSDAGNNRIQKFDLNGTFIGMWGNPGSEDGQFNSPAGIAVNSAGQVLVVDTMNYRVQMFDANGNFINKFGSKGSGDDLFVQVKDIAFDSNGNVYITDYQYNWIKKYAPYYGSIPTPTPSPTPSPAPTVPPFDFVTKWGTYGETINDFSYPVGIAVDSSDYIYIVQEGNNCIQKYDTEGNLILTWGGEGTEDGKFQAPTGITIDSNDNLYVADSRNYRIQIFDTSGNFIAKFGQAGTADGELSYPSGIQVDPYGNIYVVDYRIQKFDSNYQFLAIWGNDEEDDGYISSPERLLIDSFQNIFVTSGSKDCVMVYDDAGNYNFKWGSGGNGDGDFHTPRGITMFPSGHILIADYYNSRIQIFDPAGNYAGQFGTYGTGDGQFKYTCDVAVDSTGYVYVTDHHNSRVQKFVRNTVPIASPSPVPSPSPSPSPSPTPSPLPTPYVFVKEWDRVEEPGRILDYPYGIAADSSDNIYVGETEVDMIRKYDTEGNLLLSWGGSGTADGLFDTPCGIAVDSNDRIYVVDCNNNRIQVFDSSGNFEGKFGTAGYEVGELNRPMGITIDSADNIYVVNCKNGRILKYNSNFELLQAISGVEGSGALFWPYDAFIAPSGDIFISNTWESVMEKYDSSGNHLFTWGYLGGYNGEFNHPDGLAMNSKGELLVVDYGRNRIQIFDANGNFITKFGGIGSGEGQFDKPRDITIDSNGNLYITEETNRRVQKFAPSP